MQNPKHQSPHYTDLPAVQPPASPQHAQLGDSPALVMLRPEGEIYKLYEAGTDGFRGFVPDDIKTPKSPTRPEIGRSYSPVLPAMTSFTPKTQEQVSKPTSSNMLEEEILNTPPLKKKEPPTQFGNNAILASEALNLGVASFNYYYTLNFDHAVAFITSASRIHVTLYGITKFSAIGNVISPLYTLYNHGLTWALPHAAIAACFMFLPAGHLLGAISIASTAYGLWATYQANYGDQYYQASLQSYKAWAETAEFLAENARVPFLKTFFVNKVKAYEKEIVTLQNIIKKNGYDSCIYKAAQEEREKIKSGMSVAVAVEQMKETVKSCESLLPLEEVLAENPEQEVSGAQWKYKTDL